MVLAGSRPGNRCEAFARTIRGGKSGLRWTRCQVTPGGREPTESATENRPPTCPHLSNQGRAPARVKRCGKSAPRRWQHSTAWKTPSGARPNREVASSRKVWRQRESRVLPGRPLKGCGDAVRRGMIALDRTRLTGRLPPNMLNRRLEALPRFGAKLFLSICSQVPESKRVPGGTTSHFCEST
jgi:hypothetical protein